MERYAGRGLAIGNVDGRRPMTPAAFIAAFQSARFRRDYDEIRRLAAVLMGMIERGEWRH